MDIAAPANRRGVAKMLSHPLDSAQNGLFALRLGVEKLELLQGFGGEFCPGPCSEILGRDFFASDLAQIVIYLRRPDGVSIAIVIEVLEQLIPGQISAVLDNTRETPVIDVGLV